MNKKNHLDSPQIIKTSWLSNKAILNFIAKLALNNDTLSVYSRMTLETVYNEQSDNNSCSFILNIVDVSMKIS